MIGGRAIWRMSGDFWLDAMVQFFALEYENVEGRLIDARIGVLWQPKDWAGSVSGTTASTSTSMSTANRFTGKLEWVYDGPQIFYSVSF